MENVLLLLAQDELQWKTKNPDNFPVLGNMYKEEYVDNKIILIHLRKMIYKQKNCRQKKLLLKQLKNKLEMIYFIGNWCDTFYFLRKVYSFFCMT